ncbi:mechanosensitive ion channel domain-like protein [Medicago truncatula]|uniref:Mechanosensitive ion channel domain-like protein n=1 Tax=Medicago truncatula TaxID=3880 RepID=A0A072TZC8_MEDTR|nr:mechanosensitive ion channel domain-like protein [Medicago truncatula]
MGLVCSGLSPPEPCYLFDILRLVGEIQGEVIEIALLRTKVLTPQNILICVPNSYFAKKTISEMSDKDYHMEVHKISLKVIELKKMQKISSEVKEMLRSKIKCPS